MCTRTPVPPRQLLLASISAGGREHVMEVLANDNDDVICSREGVRARDQ